MIRQAQAKDVAEVAELDQSCFDNPYGEAFFAKAADDRSYVFFVSEEEEKVIGFIVAVNSDAYELVRIAVREDCRKTGVGKALLKQLADKPVALEVAAENTGAIAFYEQCGFVLARVRKDYYGPGKDALVCIRSAL